MKKDFDETGSCTVVYDLLCTCNGTVQFEKKP